MRVWQPGVPIGEDPIPDSTQIDYPVDSQLFRLYKTPPDASVQATALQDNSDIDYEAVPEILTNLNVPVGSVVDGRVDLSLDCTNLAGVVRYEVRISKA